MKTIIRKISNRRGAGILYALLALLVVATVSAVIITAALANNGRVENRVEEEQLYLAAESAAEIVSNDWDYNLGRAFVYKDSGWNLYWSVEGNSESKPDEEKITVPFSQYYENLANAVLNGTAPPADKTFSLSFDEEAENFKNITLEATLSAPKYTEARGSVFSVKEAGDKFNTIAVVTCDITAKYGGAENIMPYKTVITLTPMSAIMYENTVIYMNWSVNNIKQGAAE